MKTAELEWGRDRWVSCTIEGLPPPCTKVIFWFKGRQAEGEWLLRVDGLISWTIDRTCWCAEADAPPPAPYWRLPFQPPP